MKGTGAFVGWATVLLAASSLGGWLPGTVRAEAQVPCYFIFGDSLVDNGNNNYISSLAKSNYAPYGVDFPEGPTGRFCNGRTTVDVVAELLGLDSYIPPFATATGDAILTGVNYASAAAGIREETGQQLGARISLDGQIQNFQATVAQLVERLGSESAAADHLGKCIFSVGMGSNDYLNNYFMPLTYPTMHEYTPDQYADALISQYGEQLKMLYQYGARKVALTAVGPVGCSPNEIGRLSPDGSSCVEKIDSAIQIFNDKLVALVDEFNGDPELAGANFTYINSFGMFLDILDDPAAYGFTVVDTGCCGVGRNNGLITCLPYQIPCPNRDQFLFWDAYHPSEAANIIFGSRTYSAKKPSDAHPVDIRRLAQL